MARPKKPLQLLMLSGSLQHDKKRYAPRLNAPQPHPELGPPPDFLEPEQLTAWNMIVERSAPGVLTAADYPAVHLTACLYGDVLAGNRHPAIVAQLRLMLSQLGLTPASRSNVQAVDDPTQNRSPFRDI